MSCFKDLVLKQFLRPQKPKIYKTKLKFLYGQHMENNSLEKEKILDVKNITKEFPGVKALTNFSFDLYKGEVHA